ncbi:MAG: C45 family autoproteolytic acyltransferase/hydrolase [bacterium]
MKSAASIFIFFLTANLCLAIDQAAKDKLKAEKVRTDGSRTFFGEAYREERSGFTVVHLKGEPYEIGYQRGVLLKNEINYALNSIDKELRQWITEYAGVESTTAMVMLFKDLAHNQGISKMLKFIPEEYIEEMQGIADGAGVKYKDILLLNAGYDVIENLTKLYCSAFAAASPATADGRLYHGRNLDWEPPDLIAEQNILFFVQPADGIPFVNIAPSPFVCVVTAMNLQGVSVTINVSLSNEPRTEGMPTFLLLRNIVQHAATIDEAIKMIQTTPRTVGNNILISDGKNNDASLLECSSSRCEIRKPQDGLLWANNHYEHPEMKKRQYPMNIYGRNNTEGRFERLGKLLKEKAGTLDIQTLVEVFRDRYNWETGTIDSFCPQSICNPKTAQSIIFAPTDRQFSIAQPLPIPACDGKYFAFDLKQEFEGAALSAPLAAIDENLHRRTDDYKSYQHFHTAQKLIAENKQSEALGNLKTAASLSPNSASLHRQIGIILCNNFKDYKLALQYLQKAMELATQNATDRFPQTSLNYFIGKSYLGSGEYEKAIATMEKVLALKLDEDLEAWTHIRIGQCYDMLNQHEKAITHYKKAIGVKDNAASTAALNYIDKPFNMNEKPLESRPKDSYLMNAI